MNMENRIDRLAAFIRESKKPVVFTGAGVSTESGIPDFRSPGGIWSRYDPEDFTIQRYVADREARKRNWAYRREFLAVDRKPNPAHLAIAALEKMGKLLGVITQNIDGLHRDAGNSPEKIIELHGTIRLSKCLECNDRLPIQDIFKRIDAGDEDPHCRKCGGLLKAATVSFGEAMPFEEMQRADAHSRECDLFIAMGSSLVVYPAAGFPMIAKSAGARLVILNFTPTDIDAHADLVIHSGVGTVMREVMEKILG
jgi:NAD-dependent deacetylase